MPRRLSPWWRNPISLTLGAIAVTVTLHQIGWLAGLEGGVARILAPAQFWTHRAAAGIWQQLRAWRPTPGVREENRQLQAEAVQLRVANQRLRQQVEELAEASEQLAFARQRKFPSVPARVIGKTLGSEAQALTIDQGARAGIRAGLPVIARDGVLIGRVVDVGLETAKVMLLTDGRSVTPATLQTNLAAGGVISGEFGVSLKMDLIPKDQALAVGAVVMTSGLEPAFPRGLLIGTVSRVDASPGRYFQVAYLKPLVSYQTAQVVSVLLTR